MADAWRILMLFFLSHECSAQFALDPDGVVRVCTGQTQQFMCTSGGGAWTISGFSNGISDATQASALLYAPNNIRVTTTDDSTVSNPTTLTFMMLGYPDDNARVTCTDITGSSMITSTIRIAPTNCTRNFMVLNTTSSTIAIKLAVSNCNGSVPTYRVTSRSMSSGVVTTARNISPTVYLMSSLVADTAYDVDLVDIECLSVTLNRLSVRTKMVPVALDPDGVVRVCTGQNQQFMCTSGGGVWTISGFGNGISDATDATAALYAPNNIRVTTTDDSTISNPSTLTFMMLGYPDDNARVTCTDTTGSSMITSTIRIVPTNCTHSLMELNTTSSSISIKLAVSNCDGSMPTYRVTARSVSSGVVTTALNITSTVYLMSSLEADTAYDVELVDIECLNIILYHLSVTTKMVSSTDPNSSTPTSPATCSAGGTPDIVAGVAVGCLSLSLLLTAASVVITFLCTRRCYNKKSSPPPPNEKSVYYETVQSDSVQMQPSPAYQTVEELK